MAARRRPGGAPGRNGRHRVRHGCRLATARRSLDRAATVTTITEVKRRLDGTVARFDCELIARTRALVIAVYRFDDPQRGPIDSYGLFWARLPYLCYHMV